MQQWNNKDFTGIQEKCSKTKEKLNLKNSEDIYVKGTVQKIGQRQNKLKNMILKNYFHTLRTRASQKQ